MGPLSDQDDEAPFSPTGDDVPKRGEVDVRQGQQRFKFRVLKRYGPGCAVCQINVVGVLDAAHLHPKSIRGSDDPRNGLVLCASHHRAFDLGLFGINPDTFEIRFRTNGPSAEDLRITCPNLSHLPCKPHKDALAWPWKKWTRGREEEGQEITSV